MPKFLPRIECKVTFGWRRGGEGGVRGVDEVGGDGNRPEVHVIDKAVKLLIVKLIGICCFFLVGRFVDIQIELSL